LERLGDHPS
jgi:beta-carotene ketolase (CrtO type)